MAGLRSKLSSVATTSKAFSFSSKSSQTELSDIGKSLIAIDKVSENKSIVNGVKFFGHGNNRQLTSGHAESYAKIKSNQPNSSVSKKVLGDRPKVAFDLLGTISGENFHNPDEKHFLIVKLMKQNPEIFSKAAGGRSHGAEESVGKRCHSY